MVTKESASPSGVSGKLDAMMLLKMVDFLDLAITVVRFLACKGQWMRGQFFQVKNGFSNVHLTVVLHLLFWTGNFKNLALLFLHTHTANCGTMVTFARKVNSSRCNIQDNTLRTLRTIIKERSACLFVSTWFIVCWQICLFDAHTKFCSFFC